MFEHLFKHKIKKLVEDRYCRLDDIFGHAPILLATGKHS